MVNGGDAVRLAHVERNKGLNVCGEPAAQNSCPAAMRPQVSEKVARYTGGGAASDLTHNAH